MRPLLALLMIVKNEAASVDGSIASCDGAVDVFYILDTGSTDGTQKAVEVALGRQKRNGYWLQDPHPVFQKNAKRIDYAATRNRLLDLHDASVLFLGIHDVRYAGDVTGGPAVFTLFLNGDETLHDGAKLRAFLESKRDATDGAYSVEMRQGSTVWPFPRILRTDARWRYEGAVHEVPVDPRGVTGSDHFEGEAIVNGTPCIPGCYVEHVESDPARHLRRLVEFDLPTLEEMAEDKDSPVHLRCRALLYLAQTHEEVAETFLREPGSKRVFHQMAAMANYRRLSETCTPIPGARIYVNYADWHYLNVAERLDVYGPQEMLDRLGVLIQRDPLRPETRYMAAAAAAKVEDARAALLLAVQAADCAAAAREKPLPLPTDARVEWLSLRIAGACAKALGRMEFAKKLALRAVAAGAPRAVFAEFLGADGQEN